MLPPALPGLLLPCQSRAFISHRGRKDCHADREIDSDLSG